MAERLPKCRAKLADAREADRMSNGSDACPTRDLVASALQATRTNL
jgi:hypothetical protein